MIIILVHGSVDNQSNSTILDDLKLRNGLTAKSVGDAAVSELFYIVSFYSLSFLTILLTNRIKFSF